MVADVSIVVVTYQTGGSLELAIEKALSQKDLKELILVDNGNPEETLGWMRELEKENKKVTLLTGHGNVGFAKACNMGAAKATGAYLLLLNPDVLLPENALVDSKNALKDRDDIWGVCGRLLNPDGSEQAGARRQILTPQNAVSESLCLHLFGWQRMNQHQEELPDAPVEVEAISGAYMFMRRERYDELGGLDEEYFLHVEDMDLCRRVHDAGGKLLFVPSLKLVHLKGTSRASAANVELHKTQGFIRYIRKFYSDAVYYPMMLGLWGRYGIKLVVDIVRRILPEGAGRMSARRLLWLHQLVRKGDPEKLPYQDKTVVVTGALSQIGVCAIGRLLAGGAKVIAVVHQSSVAFEHPNLTWLKADLKEGSIALDQNVKPDLLIHAAPLWLLRPILSDIFNARVKRVIAFSSTSVFVKIYSANQSERNTVEQLEEAELYLAERCRKAAANFTILRPTMIYGLGLDENVSQVSDFIRRYRFFPLYPPAEGRRQPVHADDLAQIALKVMDNEKTYNKSYNIGGGEVLTYRAMVERIFYALGQTPRIVKIKQLPTIMDIVGKWVFRGKVNGEMARRMNQDLIFADADMKRDFSFKLRGFLPDGKRDLGQL